MRAGLCISCLRRSAEHETRCRVRRRRVVGAVHLRVAVHAAAPLPHGDDVLAAGGRADGRGKLARRGRRVDPGLPADRADVARQVRRVALLAQDRRPNLQQRSHRAAMRAVAAAAVLRHGFVLVHEGPALFGVAGVAGLVGAVHQRQLRARRPMGVVAVRASHLPLGHRVVRRPQHLRALLLVAGVADLGLHRLAQHAVLVRMHLVAGGTGEVGAVVVRCRPTADA